MQKKKQSSKRDYSLHTIYPSAQPHFENQRLRTESHNFMYSQSKHEGSEPFPNVTFIEDEFQRLSKHQLQDKLALQIEQNKLIQGEINLLKAQMQSQERASFRPKSQENARSASQIRGTTLDKSISKLTKQNLRQICSLLKPKKKKQHKEPKQTKQTKLGKHRHCFCQNNITEIDLWTYKSVYQAIEHFREHYNLDVSRLQLEQLMFELTRIFRRKQQNRLNSTSHLRRDNCPVHKKVRQAKQVRR